jgi:hypothetical protein
VGPARGRNGPTWFAGRGWSERRIDESEHEVIMRGGGIARATAACALVLLSLTGCGAAVPTDPDGTLERARGGVLRVGVTDNGRWVGVREGDDPVGTEPDLVRSFAAVIDADVAWTSGSEQELVRELEDGELDLVVGGLTDDTPWSEKAGMTRPYTESTDERGGTRKHVMLVRMGENDFLLELDRFLLDRDGTP